jgi:WD40 repeat protein
MVSYSSDNLTIKCWSLPNAQLITKETVNYTLISMALSPDGAFVAECNNLTGDIGIFSLPNFEPVSDIDIDDYAGCMVYSSDGSLLAAGLVDGSVKLFSMPGGELATTLDRHTKAVRSIAISSDGKLLASGSEDGTVALTSLPQGELIAILEGHEDTVDAIAFSPDGTMLATRSADSKAMVRRIPDGEIIKDLTSVRAVAFSLRDSLFVYSDQFNYVHVESLLENRNIATLLGHTKMVSRLALSGNGAMLASGDLSGSILLWSLPAGTLFACPIDLDANTDDMNGITYETTNSAGGTVTYTLPCGSPIPAGAVCVCNCVAGGCACVGHSTCSCVGYSVCNCVGHTTSGGHYWYPD